MADRKDLIEAIDAFYGDIIEKYKELERQVAAESGFTSIFKKVDYKARIERFKALKRKAQSINVKKLGIGEEDELSAQALEKLGISLSYFVRIIDAQVSCQTFLYKKSERKKVDNLDYKKAVYNVRKVTEELQNSLRNLDAVYANLEEYE